MTTNKGIEEIKVLAGASVWILIITTVSLVVFGNTLFNRVESLERESSRQWDYYRTLS